MGHAAQARYRGMFGGKPLEDLDMMEHAHDVVASATKTLRKPSTSRSLFGASGQEEIWRFQRVRMRRLGHVDAAAPQFGNQYTPEEATQILLDFKRKNLQIKPIMEEWIANHYIPIEWSAMNDRVNNALKHENAGSNFVEFVRRRGESGRPNLPSTAQTGDERKAENRPPRGC